MRFVRTLSFATSNAFDSSKDDREVNQALQEIQESGAEVIGFNVLLAGRQAGATSLFVIEYEATAPLR